MPQLIDHFRELASNSAMLGQWLKDLGEYLPPGLTGRQTEVRFQQFRYALSGAEPWERISFIEACGVLTEYYHPMRRQGNLRELYRSAGLLQAVYGTIASNSQPVIGASTIDAIVALAGIIPGGPEDAVEGESNPWLGDHIDCISSGSGQVVSFVRQLDGDLMPVKGRGEFEDNYEFFRSLLSIEYDTVAATHEEALGICRTFVTPEGDLDLDAAIRHAPTLAATRNTYREALTALNGEQSRYPLDVVSSILRLHMERNPLMPTAQDLLMAST